MLLFAVASGFTSYEEMNEWEINNVFNDSARNIDGNLIVMGDFNTGYRTWDQRPEFKRRTCS